MREGKIFADKASPSAERCAIPVFVDMGADGFWRDMLANSPWLNVSDYDDGARRDHPDALRASLSFHADGDSRG